MNTPVLFLIFNRPDMTAQVFEAIAKAKPCRLFVAADGPRPGTAGEAEKCQKAREIINRVDWDCDVKTLFRDQNLGCKIAVSSAIDWFFGQVEEGIILEDDCLPADSFFPFCTELLEKYRDDERIMMISGDNFQDGIQRGEASYYFSRIAHIWGWATWRRAWELYDAKMNLVDDFRYRSLIHEIFVDRNIALSWALAFASVRVGALDSWGYAWIYTMFASNGLSVIPDRNLVTNVGFGVGGSHTTNTASRFANMKRFDLNDLIHPSTVYCHEQADLYEYTRRGIYPFHDNMSMWYSFKRMRKAARLKRKIYRLYEHTANQGNIDRQG